jgi:hypothetical protein
MKILISNGSACHIIIIIIIIIIITANPLYNGQTLADHNCEFLRVVEALRKFCS